MKVLETTIDIEAPAARVWQLLTDVAAYPEWNPFIRRISGELAPGARPTVRLQPLGGRGISLRPTVLAVAPNGELRWRGRLGLPGLFDGEHSFTIEPLGAGRVRFTQREVFTGLLVPLVARALDRGTRYGFEAMNAALKARAEAALASWSASA